MGLEIVVILLLLLAGNVNCSSAKEQDLSSLIIDIMRVQRSPNIVLENLCWAKGAKVRFYRQIIKNNARFVSFKTNNISLDNMKRFFTIVSELDCNFEQLFRQANTEGFLTHPNVWIVFGSKDTFKKLRINIPVNVLFIKIFERGTVGNFSYILRTVYKTHKKHNGYIETSLGSWSPNGGMVDYKGVILTRNRTNFGGIPLRISYVIGSKSSFKHITDYREKHMDNLTKINYILLRFVCDLLNTTQINIVRLDWGFKSRQANNSFTKGIFGDIIYDRADISGTLSFTPAYRLQYFKYLFAPMKEFTVFFIFRAPPLAYYSNLFELPFDKMVWFTIVALSVFCGVLIKLVFDWEGKRNFFEVTGENRPRFLDVVMMQIAIVCQMDFYHEPKSLSGKLVTFTVLISATFIYTAYCARIVLLLQSNTNSITDLEALYNAKLDFGVEDQSFNRYYFTGSSDRTNEQWRRIIYENKIKSAKGDKFLHVSKGMQLVRDTYFAFHVEKNAANYLIGETFTNDQLCSLRAVETIYKSDIPHLFCHKNSPFVEFFLVSFRRLSETGVYNREYRKCFTKQPTCLGKGNIFVSVGFRECHFVFVAFGSGIVLSILIFIIERISSLYITRKITF